MILLAGDVLLYKGKGLYGCIIGLKTWHPIAHVECFVGDGKSVASRDGIGTGLYDVRWTELVTVCRPVVPFDVDAARAWFDQQPHQPYGWLDLLQFIGVNINAPGVVCSPFVTEFLRAGGLDPFNGEPAQKIAPFEFTLSPAFVKLSAESLHA